MVRLVSAYRDRVAGLKAPARLYRKVAAALNLSRVDAVLPYNAPAGRPVAVPSWPEFIRFLLATDRSDYVSQ